jgi:hypothetical protein
MFGSKRPTPRKTPSASSQKAPSSSPFSTPTSLDKPFEFVPGTYEKALDSFAALQYESKPSRQNDLQYSAMRSRAKIVPSEASQKLVASLPKDMSLLHLYSDFAHVLNKLAAAWAYPPVFYALMDQYLLDRRGDRQGFPFRVAMELSRLSEHYAQYVAPRKINKWDTVERPRRSES